MNEVFQEFLRRFVIVYIDNILIYSRKPGRPLPPRCAGPPEASAVPSVPQTREMQVPSPHGAVPGIHHQEGRYPDGPGEGNSCGRMADSPDD